MGVGYSSITDDGYVSVDSGQWRGTQLAVTRALSHQLLLQAGVVPEPEVRGRLRCSHMPTATARPLGLACTSSWWVRGDAAAK